MPLENNVSVYTTPAENRQAFGDHWSHHLFLEATIGRQQPLPYATNGRLWQSPNATIGRFRFILRRPLVAAGHVQCDQWSPRLRRVCDQWSRRSILNATNGRALIPGKRPMVASAMPVQVCLNRSVFGKLLNSFNALSLTTPCRVHAGEEPFAQTKTPAQRTGVHLIGE